MDIILERKAWERIEERRKKLEKLYKRSVETKYRQTGSTLTVQFLVKGVVLKVATVHLSHRKWKPASVTTCN